MRQNINQPIIDDCRSSLHREFSYTYRSINCKTKLLRDNQSRHHSKNLRLAGEEIGWGGGGGQGGGECFARVPAVAAFNAAVML